MARPPSRVHVLSILRELKVLHVLHGGPTTARTKKLKDLQDDFSIST